MRLASLCMVLGLLQLDVHLHWGLDADDLADGLGFRPRSDLT
jgi:hypothetical protein